MSRACALKVRACLRAWALARPLDIGIQFFQMTSSLKTLPVKIKILEVFLSVHAHTHALCVHTAQALARPLKRPLAQPPDIGIQLFKLILSVLC